MSARPSSSFNGVFEMVKRVVEARGVREAGGSQIDYTEGGLTLSRTALNEYEVSTEAGVVFRARHTGALSSAHVFEEGDWVEEVRRLDGEVRGGGRK